MPGLQLWGVAQEERGCNSTLAAGEQMGVLNCDPGDETGPGTQRAR
jgi:hypothetical protein